jgi:hypothetical protein
MPDPRLQEKDRDKKHRQAAIKNLKCNTNSMKKDEYELVASAFILHGHLKTLLMQPFVQI